MVRTTIWPPYWGFASLSHQLPTVVLVEVVGGAVVGLDVGVDVGVDVGAEIEVVVVVDFAQDAKTSDVTMRQVSTIQIAPLFITPSLLFYRISKWIYYFLQTLIFDIAFDIDCLN